MSTTTPATTPATTGLAIGSVICYGGDLSVAANVTTLNAAGWLPCDGSSYTQSDYPDLFAAIGTASGGDATHFNVPDLRNCFVRGANGNVGSVQTAATALPANTPFTVASAGTHTHTVPHLTLDQHMAWDGSTDSMARLNSPTDTDVNGAHYHEMTGFDSETAPINVALYFIIKANEPATPDGATLAGAIAGFAGTLTTMPDGWLACDGTPHNVADWTDLNTMISFNYGGNGTSIFNLPDLRGQFLRGTSHSTGRDPDAGSRSALNTGGAVGDNTGSAQGYATAMPANFQTASAGLHTHNLAKVPNTDHHAAMGASGPLAFDTMAWTDALSISTSAGEHTHTVTGGDTETRPANVALEMLIASDNLTSGPPIGSIMPFGGDTTLFSNEPTLLAMGWLPCNGDKLTVPTASEQTYQALYDVIGTNFGSNTNEFLLPDLRGYFVSGAWWGTKVGDVQTQSMTGAPVNPIITSTDGDHQHTFSDTPDRTQEIDVCAGNDLAENNTALTATSADGAHTHTVTGGDSETRPMNVNVDYVIRFK
jgi:microcystin-dependent protein